MNDLKPSESKLSSQTTGLQSFSGRNHRSCVALAVQLNRQPDVIQLDRSFGYEPRGRGFESRRPDGSITPVSSAQTRYNVMLLMEQIDPSQRTT